jgi:hypothetical protein
VKSIAAAFAAALAVAASSSAPADEAPRDLCPDRPGKGTSACTVDEGRFQLESDIFNGSFQRTGGVTTDIWLVTDPNLKYGVADNFDVEANLSPLVLVRTHDAKTGATSVIGGVGDLFLRAKLALVGNSGSDFALALDPFLKLPTARIGIGNGAVEGGVAVPISLSLGGGWSVGSTPELDVLKDAADDGRHVTLTDVVGIDRSVGDGVTLGAECWESTNFDPMGTAQSWSLDLNAAWQPEGDANLQLDGGVNLGLNRNTPGSQIYTGVSERF